MWIVALNYYKMVSEKHVRLLSKYQIENTQVLALGMYMPLNFNPTRGIF